MKKLFIFMMLVLVCFVTLNTKSYAKQESLPVGRNYFDFSTIFKKVGGVDTYHTLEPFRVKINTDYTLVMSKAFLKELYADIENEVFEITAVPSFKTYEYAYVKDLDNERVYVEFLNFEEYLDIDYIHMPNNTVLPNYEVILYEGYYEDFFGFEPYLSPNDQVDHYGNLLINYDQLLTTETISSYISARDPNAQNIDLNLTHDTYSASSKLPGTYEMIYESTFNRIKKQYILSVIVEDLTPPVISIAEPILISLTNKVDINTIKTYINVSDNVDHLNHTDLVVTNDTYSAATTVGSYQMTVEATDLSGNKTTYPFTIDLVDLEGPKFKGPDELYLYVSDQALTTAEILNYYTITDDVELDESSIKLTLDQYQQKTAPGLYQITISATDHAGNTTTKDLYMHVIDNRGPEFNVNQDYIITVTPNQLKTETDIIDWLSTKLKDEGIQARNIKVNHNEYELRATTKGQYYVYLDYEVDDQVHQTRVLMDVADINGFEFKPIYLLSLIPIGIMGAIIIYKKKKIIK